MTDSRTFLSLAASIAALASVAASLLGASPAQAVIGGCSVGSAAVIQSGQTQTSDPKRCPDNKEYWAIDLKIGDSLRVSVNPAPPSVFVEPYLFDVYGPDVGTIGNYLCQSEGSGPSLVSCVIPATGRYVLVTYGAGTFTPAVKTVRPQKGRVAGACDPMNAPTAADRVAQYANGIVCRPSGSIQYWSMRLRRGDTLTTSSLGMPSSGNAEPFDLQVYGPSATSLGNKLCGNSGFGPSFSFHCRIRTSGRYVLAASNSGSFTPLVVHPTRTRISVKGSRRLVVEATIRSDAPNPVGTCVFQEKTGARWLAVAHEHTTAGSCKQQLRVTRHGSLQLRVRFKGGTGWASSTSKSVTLHVAG